VERFGTLRFGGACYGRVRLGGAGFGSLFLKDLILMSSATAVGLEITNGAAQTIEHSFPYRVGVRIKGDADILFHRWNCEAVEAKSKAAKGSKAKKTDDVESYVYRNDDGELCLPGEYLRQAMIAAAKFKQDPRSPRKSAMDLVKAAIVSLTPLASLGVNEWDYEHKCRVQVQRNGITRVRPALKTGWQADFILLVTLPEYVNEELLRALINDAGRLIGLADFRPTYGRFSVVKFEMLD
jgi:hypothetical protein